MLFNLSNKRSNLSDEDLLIKFQKTGNNEYISTLFDRYSHLIYGLCLTYFKDPVISKDAVLEIFEKLMNKLGGSHIQKFKPWLYTVSKNHCLNMLEKKEVKASYEQVLLLAAEEHETVGHNTEDTALKEERLEALLLAIEALKPEQKVCVELFYLKQKPYEEVAQLTGFSMLQVKSYLQNGKRNLKILMNA